MNDKRDELLELGEREQRVLSALGRMEAEDRSTYAQDVASTAGLNEDETRQALHELTTRHNVVREVADEPGPRNADLGPQYEIRQPD